MILAGRQCSGAAGVPGSGRPVAADLVDLTRKAPDDAITSN